ncbi:MAG: GguC protein [Rhodobacteraceae bacterium]|nr:GguC protein [Paracoccaceae bacterium]PHR55401.1 MAG: GguC protein [Robiginitomaculum sp.]
MLVSQILSASGELNVVAREGSEAYIVKDAGSLLDLAREAIGAGISLTECITRHGLGAPVDLAQAYGDARLQLPINHPDPTHMHLTGTGLTHLGSASTRDAMHAGATENLTDSMKMFQMGLKGGRPEAGEVGAQPEWFYKGNGTMAVAPGQALTSPSFAMDGGEEPEIAGIYVIGPDGTPFRVGFALANEFSDHVTERVNYLFLAHSKLRPCSFGPEILLGELPDDVQGMSRILRDGAVHWQKPFASGEANMSHTLANLEHHHFKYDVFCQPGDVHVHMFGTATLSFADGIKAEDGDIFEIESSTFGLPLRNVLKETAPIATAKRVQIL